MGRVLKSSLCIIMVLAVLCLSMTVYAADPEPSPTPIPQDPVTAINESVMSYYIWLCMKAWGIDIKYQDMDSFMDEVDQIIVEWVIEYLQSLPSAYSISTWIAPWQGDYDYWGNLRLNSSALEDIQDFVNWLIGEKDIVDNSSQIVDAVEVIGGYPIREFDKYYRGSYEIPLTESDLNYYDYVALKLDDVANTGLIGYIQVHLTDAGSSTKWRMYVLAPGDISSSGTVKLYRLKDTGSETGSNSASFSGNWGTVRNNIRYKYDPKWQWEVVGNDYPPNNRSFFVLDGQNFEGTITEFETFLNNATITQDGDINIITADIVLPIESPDYTGGDSITIIDGEPDYSVIEWDGEVTVSNLPAIVSTGTIQDPGIGEFFGWIPTLVNTTKDSMEFFQQILFMMPDQVLICMYSVLGAGVLFGILRLMREH